MKNKVSDKIKQDIDIVIDKLIQEVNEYHLYPNFDLEERRGFLQSYVPEQIKENSKQLLRSLLIYLEDDALAKLKDIEAKQQNRFFNKKFKEKVHEWVDMQSEFITSELATKSITIAQKQALIQSGVTFVLGAGVTGLVATTVPLISLVTVIIGGLITLWITYQTYKASYTKATDNLREDLKRSTNEYMDGSKAYLKEWLEEVIKVYQGYFNDFCKEAGLEEFRY